ncbi:unnamed protein product [Rhizophagus irregularis]|nr:unnamed protein product [Rhizophagus irregularis]CAB4431940.1 unnamed protein product [Rhizophagus irregularis]
MDFVTKKKKNRGVSPRADHTPKLKITFYITLPSPSRKPRKHRISLSQGKVSLRHSKKKEMDLLHKK